MKSRTERGRSALLNEAAPRRTWIAWLTREMGLSPQRVRQHMEALKFFYTKTLWKPENVSFLSWPSDRPRAHSSPARLLDTPEPNNEMPIA